MGKRNGLLIIGLFMAVLFLNTRQSVAQTTPDRRFGMTEVFWLPQEARELGVGWERILFYWREIQPTGPEDWNTLHVLEEWLVEANSQGREVVGLIKNTAPWASVDGTEAGLPKGLYLPTDDPENLWANYVGRLADYYGKRGVHHWIIWNEPEIEPGVYGFEFGGTAADYYQLLKTAYKVIKDRDPEATIHLAGLTWWHDPTFLDRLLTIAAADPEGERNGYFFDAISLHVYFRTETVRTIIEEVNDIQGRYGLEKPIWINETNAPPNSDPEWPVNRPRFNVDLEQQAWFIVQAIALGFASGAERVSVYKLLDIHLPDGGESFGVLRPDQSRRPAYYAYKMVTRCFGAFEAIDMEESALAYRITFSRPGMLTHVAWSRTPSATTVSIPAKTGSASLLRLLSPSDDVLPVDGMYQLQLPGQRCDEECLVGGEPLLLLETLDEARYQRLCERYLTAQEPSILEEALEEEKLLNGAGDDTQDGRLVTPAAQRADDGVIDIQPSPTVKIADERQNDSRLSAKNEGDVNADMTVTALPARQTPVASSEAASDSVEASIVSQESGKGAPGLWIFGLALAVALVTVFLARRSRTDKLR